MQSCRRFQAAWAFFACVCGSLQGRAEQPAAASHPQLQLVRPNSLTGWDHGAEFPRGWTADGTQLMGGAGAAPLVCGWTLGDFGLELAWRTKAGGVLEVRLLDVPQGEGISVSLAAGDDCGRIRAGEKALARGRKLRFEEGEPQRCAIRREAGLLRVMLNGELAAQAQVAADRRFGLSLHVPQGVVAINDLTLSEPRGEQLFNGQDLTNWWTHRKQDVWAVENGELVTTKNGGEYLRSEKDYANFTLSFEYLMERGGNSGVGIRTPREGWPSGDGMELQLYDRPGKDPGSQMSIYKFLPPLERPDISEQWNHVVIKCDGPTITAWVNGQIAQHANLARHPQLAKKPPSGWVGFQNHGSLIRIKNVYLLEAPDRARADESAVPAYAAAMKKIAAGFTGTPGVVLHVGDSITHANPYGQWARFGKGQTEEDKQVLEWMHTGKGNELDGWHLAAVDRPGGHSDTACGGIRADEMLAGSRGDFPSLKKLMEKYKPQMVVLMLGTNDASAGRKVEDYLRDMAACVDAIEAASAICILSTIPPHIGRPELAASYNEGLRKLAGERKLPLIDYEREILKRRPDDWNGTLLNHNDVHPTHRNHGVDSASAPTEENLKSSGYLLRGWLSVQKIKEVKRHVLDQ